jgi:hypothetical protein
MLLVLCTTRTPATTPNIYQSFVNLKKKKAVGMAEMSLSGTA